MEVTSKEKLTVYVSLRVAVTTERVTDLDIVFSTVIVMEMLPLELREKDLDAAVLSVNEAL